MNKKIFTLMICMILLIGIVAVGLYFSIGKEFIQTPTEISQIQKEINERRALIDESRRTDLTKEHNSTLDLYKSYDSSTKEILIEDNDKTLIKMRLTSPYVVSSLIASSDTKVAEFYLEDWKEDKINLIDAISFYDVNDNYKPTNKTFRFKWGTETEECFDISEKEKECYNNTVWTEFETLNELPHKNIKISLWANTEVLEKIEWIPTIEGFEILQWAEWEVSTVSYTGDSFYVLPQEATSSDLFFKPDGYKMYIIGYDTKKVYQYSLSTAWNVSTATSDYKNFSVVAEETTPTALFFSSAGDKMYISGNDATDNIIEYNLSTPWDINSTSHFYTLATSLEGNMQAISFSSAGDEMYTVGYAGDTVYQYHLSTAWDISTAVDTGNKISVTAKEVTPLGLFFKPDGLRMYVCGDSNSVYQYHLSTAWNVTTASYNSSKDVSSQDTTPQGVFFTPDGLGMYFNSYNNDRVYQYNLSSPDKISPTFTNNTPQNQTIAYGVALAYDINATDETGFDCFAVNDTTNFQINCSGMLENATTLSVALYNLNITINDTSNNLNSALMWVNVIQAGDTFNVSLNGLENNLSVIYPQQVNVSVSNQDTTATIDVNGTIFTSGTNYTLGAGVWFVNVSVDGNQNYTSNESHWYITVNQAGNPLDVLLNGVANNLSAIYPQQVNVSVSNNDTTATIDVNGTIFTSGTNYTLGTGVWFVNVSAIGNQNYTNNESHWYITVSYPIPDIQFEDPTFVHFYNLTSYNFLANVSVTETYFKNITFNLYNSTNKLISSDTFIDSTRAFNYTVTYDNTYNYSVIIATTHETSNTTEARTINIDTIYPIINITYPINGTVIQTYINPHNVSFNASVSDLHLSSCSYFNGTANVTITCGNNASINLSYGAYNLLWYANDSFGHQTSARTTFFIDYIQPSFNYPATAIEGETYSFNISFNATYDLTFLNGLLYYNGTAYNTSSSITGSAGTLNSNIYMGNVSSNEVRSFFWDYSVNDGTTNRTSLSYNHTVYDVNLLFVNVSCSPELSPAMCFGFESEINLTSNTVDMDYNFQFGLSASSYQSSYGNLSNISEFCLCINSSISNNYSLGSGEIHYSSSGFTDRRFYTFSNQRLSNATINNTLYSLASSSATSFLFEFKETNLDPYVDNYSSLLRWYPNLNEYRIVEMAKTDDKGQTIMRVKVEDVDYRVGLYHQDGRLIKLLNPVRFACLSSPCSYSTIVEEDPTDYTAFLNVETSLEFNETSNIWTYIWNDPSQNTESMSLLVRRIRGNGTYNICDTSASGYTGVLTCNSTGFTGTLEGVAYRTASPAIPIAQRIVDIGITVFAGTLGLFISFIIFLVLALIGVFSPVASVVLGLVGLIPAVIFGSITLPIFIAIGVMGGIIIHFMKRTR